MSAGRAETGTFRTPSIIHGTRISARRTATSRRTDPPPNPARHRSGSHRRGAGDGRRIQRAHVVVEDRPRSHRPHPAVEHRRPHGADPRRPCHRPLVRSAAGDPPARSRSFELRQLRYVGIGYPDSGRRHPPPTCNIRPLTDRSKSTPTSIAASIHERSRPTTSNRSKSCGASLRSNTAT